MEQNQSSVTKPNILIVDDDLDTCQILILLFSGKGYLPVVAMNGNEALKRVSESQPDIILLDIMIPDMDGWDVIQRIRPICDAPVLFLSALNSGETAARALTMGGNDYVQKPFSHIELLMRVEAILNRSKTKLIENSSNPVDRPTVSVVIPTLNEAENLPLVLPYIPREWLDEVILVDGRSMDGTVDVAKKLMPDIKIVLEKEPGKGAAMQAGYRAASGDIVIVMDADGSNDPREIPRFVNALIEGADFVKGSRFTPGGGTTDMPEIRKMGNLFFVKLVNLLFGSIFSDLCYGYHAFWRYCLDIIDLSNAKGFEIDTVLYVRAVRDHLRITEVPSFEGYRFYGIGKLRTIPDGLRVLSTIGSEWIQKFKTSSCENHIGFRGTPSSRTNSQLKLWNSRTTKNKKSG